MAGSLSLASLTALVPATPGAAVADGAGARPHLGAVTAAAILADAGIEPVLQLTCRDRNRIALQSDGKIVIAGNINSDFGIERFTSTGAPDTAFGSSGALAVDFFGAFDSGLDVVIQPDGKLIVAGAARNGSSSGLGMVRVLP